MLAQVTHIIPVTTIRRERLLPVPGRVQVRRGQKVKPLDVVAEADLAPEHLLLSVSRGLGLPAEAADALIQRRPGDDIVEGDVIASRGGIARRVVRAPVSGRVVMVGEGQILIEAEKRPFQLMAGLAGNVIQVIQERGAVIETTGALIQGVWGNGRLDFGLMAVVTDDPQEPLQASQMDVRMRGSIVVAGHCQDEETLQAAAELALRGLVLSSLPARLLPLARKLRFPVLVIEGFGFRPLSPATFKLLSTNDNKEAVLNAQHYNRHEGVRPELVIPLPAPTQTGLPQDAVELAPGKRVRIVRDPHAGATGSISSLRSRLMAFPSGVRAPAALVTLADGETIQVPIPNLEILE